MDIRDRLKKLASLVRHDEEALSTCEDAIKEIDRLSSTGTFAVTGSGGGNASVPWVYRIGGGPPPPSQTTQVKMDGFGQIKTDLDLLRRLYQSVVPTRGV